MAWIIADFWGRVEGSLFPQLEESLGPLTDKQKQLVAVLELIRIEAFVPPSYLHIRGRRPADRRAVARAFVAKAVYNMATTRVLLDQLKSSPPLRRICGWEKAGEVPSESVFSRAFARFASSELPQRAHEAVVRAHVAPHVVHHVARDSTANEGREKALAKPKAAATDPAAAGPKRKPGRPKKERRRRPRSRHVLSVKWGRPGKRHSRRSPSCAIGGRRRTATGRGIHGRATSCTGT